MHGVEAVHAEVTQQRLEEVVLRRVLQQVRGDAVSGDLETGIGLGHVMRFFLRHASCSYLFINFNCFIVFLEGGRVFGDLDKALVGAAGGLLPLEVVCGGLVVQDHGVQVGHVVLEQLRHRLVVLGRDGEPLIVLGVTKYFLEITALLIYIYLPMSV